MKKLFVIVLYVLIVAARDAAAPVVRYYEGGEEICIDGQCEAEQD